MDKQNTGPKRVAYDRSDTRPAIRLAMSIVNDPNGILDEIKRLDPCCLDDIWIGIASVVVKKPPTMRNGLAMIQKMTITSMRALPKNRSASCHRWLSSKIAAPR
jgi:hypothetical protein